MAGGIGGLSSSGSGSGCCTRFAGREQGLIRWIGVASMKDIGEFREEPRKEPRNDLRGQ